MWNICYKTHISHKHFQKPQIRNKVVDVFKHWFSPTNKSICNWVEVDVDLDDDVVDKLVIIKQLVNGWIWALETFT